MRVLIVGGGGREHALGWKIAQSPLLGKLYFAPGNPGTSALGENVKLSNNEAITAFSKAQGVDLVVVGPEVPLVAGLADSLREAGVACFGPGAAGARLEGSKAFAKQVMIAAGVPTAKYGEFTDLNDALAYVRGEAHPLVVKADGLAAGKGVIICQTLAESEAALQLTMAERKFGDAGAKVVIEEFLVGTETSFHIISDGSSHLPLITAKDHKTLCDGDTGPNTGGMGTFSPNPLIDEAMAERIKTDICDPVFSYLHSQNIPFQGVLFVGLMMTATGPKVLEFNVRFGDPETQVMMPMLDFDLLPVLHGAARGRLPGGEYPNKKGAAVCVVLAAHGYPEDVRKGDVIEGLDLSFESGIVFHAGTREEDGKILSNGGRVLGLTAWADRLEDARASAYNMVSKISFAGNQVRTDIGGHMKEPKVTVLMGSDNDYDIMQESVKVMKQFEIPFEVFVTSAHRTPERTVEIIDGAVAKGVKVFIVGAGAAAHLAGVVAAHTTLPVIGVPIDASALKGVDALYATVMMPGGIPVASMAIGKAGAKNAGLLAASILSTSDESMVEQLRVYRANMVTEVTAKSDALQERVNS